LSLVDDGVGLPAGFDPTASKGMGMPVVTSLVNRLDPTPATESHGAKTAFVVTHHEEARR
jgi:two-component sensor histidine kinase